MGQQVVLVSLQLFLLWIPVHNQWTSPQHVDNYIYMGCSSQLQHYLAAGCVFEVLGSLVTDPSWTHTQKNMDTPTLKNPGPIYMCRKNLDPKTR